MLKMFRCPVLTAAWTVWICPNYDNVCLVTFDQLVLTPH